MVCVCVCVCVCVRFVTSPAQWPDPLSGHPLPLTLVLAYLCCCCLADEASTSADARTMLGVSQDGFSTARDKQVSQENCKSEQICLQAEASFAHAAVIELIHHPQLPSADCLSLAAFEACL
jgi:hypothetical protein